SANRLLKVASGTHVYFAAADDLLLPGFLEQSMQMLAGFPSAGLCSTFSRIIDEEGRVVGIIDGGTFRPKHATYLSPADAGRALYRHGSWIQGNTTVFCRAALIGVGGFRPELASYCDGFAEEAIALRYGAC